jgi:hypothetical protein
MRPSRLHGDWPALPDLIAGMSAAERQALLAMPPVPIDPGDTLLEIGRRLGLRITERREAPTVIHHLLQSCFWTNLDILIDWALKETERQLDAGEVPALSPFAISGLPAPLELRLRVAKAWAGKFDERARPAREFFGPFEYRD